jgi:hypothetical protein
LGLIDFPDLAPAGALGDRFGAKRIFMDRFRQQPLLAEIVSVWRRQFQ